MRLNQYIALATGMSRRAADEAIRQGKVTVTGTRASIGTVLGLNDVVKLNGHTIKPDTQTVTIMLNKPVGYVCSRNGQGSKTIYNLLSKEYHHLKPVGRLDKDSSGLLLLTNDGQLANKLTHPRYKKEKEYEVTLNQSLDNKDKQAIESGVMLEDGISSFELRGQAQSWTITMREGRNRQIRRTFESLGYRIVRLHRIGFGNYKLNSLNRGEYLLLLS